MLLRVYLGVIATDSNAVEGLSARRFARDLSLRHNSAFVLMHTRRGSMMVDRDEQPLSGAMLSRANAAQVVRRAEQPDRGVQVTQLLSRVR